jgi:DtxR family Mn-dependent transcriptional regulator
VSGRPEALDHLLRDLWIRVVEAGESVEAESLPREALGELVEKGYVRVQNGRVILTSRGEEAGRTIVRLHRLTERLLFDILGMEKKVLESIACQVEHTIPPELEEAICTLLGHPRKCPHGRPIPPGRCCLEGLRTVPSLIVPLREVREGEEAKISYTDLDPKMEQYLAELGLVPGTRIRVARTKPAYILERGEARIAVDSDTALRIYVVRLPPRKA